MAFRAFIAVDVQLGQEALDIWKRVEATGADLKMVNPKITHVTLKFLGDTDEALVEDIGAVLGSAVKDAGPFEVELKGLGVFPKPSYIKVVWMGMEGAEPMVQLAKDIEAGLKPMGFKKDKPFRPHLTIARLRGGRRADRVASLVEAHPDTSFGAFRVEEVVLKKSVLTPEGPIYSDVKNATLG
jgi:2'-5' RNA ligase